MLVARLISSRDVIFLTGNYLLESRKVCIFVWKNFDKNTRMALNVSGI